MILVLYYQNLCIQFTHLYIFIMYTYYLFFNVGIINFFITNDDHAIMV